MPAKMRKVCLPSQWTTILYLVAISICQLPGSSHAGDLQGKEQSELGEEGKFIPTHEWQVVKKDQAVPPGLHIRMNLETGITEAKLLDEEEASPRENAVQAVSVSDEEEKPVKIFQTPAHVDGVHVLEDEDGGQSVFAHGKLTAQQIQKALHNIPYEDMEVASAEDQARVGEKFRSIDELKAELGDANLGVRTEAEQVAELMKQYLDPDASREDKVVLLSELQYIAHQHDAARDFIENFGLQLIIIPCLNASSELQMECAKLLGAASQGNFLVQVSALRSGVIRLVLRIVEPDSCYKLAQKAKCKAMIHAVSCLIRGYPQSQQNFVTEGGVSVFAQIFDVSGMEIKIKIATLFHDLLLESQQPPDDLHQHYKAVQLENFLVQSGWCGRVATLLTSWFEAGKVKSVSSWSLEEQHDLVEKMVSVMLVLHPACNAQFTDTLPIVMNLLQSYDALAKQEELRGDSANRFYFDLFHLVHKLSLKIATKDEL
ncbi:hypothetical protein B566_EDAN011535 [Ephemera danica]|nr:hypothetical protein B566_EDAN011535 [Ephemera danica]